MALASEAARACLLRWVFVPVLVSWCFMCSSSAVSWWLFLSLSSVCEVLADGLLELGESTALMSDHCIKAVIKHFVLCVATPYKRLLTVLGLREKPLKAPARMREAANPPAGCHSWTNWRHPHMSVLTAMFDFVLPQGSFRPSCTSTLLEPASSTSAPTCSVWIPR